MTRQATGLCPSCGAAVTTRGLLAGMCPHCLLCEALEARSSTEPDASRVTADGESRRYLTRRDTVPDPEPPAAHPLEDVGLAATAPAAAGPTARTPGSPGTIARRID